MIKITDGMNDWKLWNHLDKLRDRLIEKKEVINLEKKKDQDQLKKIIILEVPYKITKEYFAREEKEYLESIQNWDSKSEEERSELHGD